MDLTHLDDEVLIQELMRRGYIRVLWTKDDIVHAAEDAGVVLTEDEIDIIITNLEENHDANYGLSWDTINDVLWSVVGDREPGKEEQ